MKELCHHLLDLCGSIAHASGRDEMRRAILSALADLAGGIRSACLYGLTQGKDSYMALARLPHFLEVPDISIGDAQRDAMPIHTTLILQHSTLFSASIGVEQLREMLFGVGVTGEILAVPGRFGNDTYCDYLAFLLLRTNSETAPMDVHLFDRFMHFAMGELSGFERLQRQHADARLLEADLTRQNRKSATLRLTLQDQIAARIKGKASAMLTLRQQIVQVADTDLSVLVMGETGTGKELIARELHGLSRRRDKPFIAVNVAAMPESLIEDELFGHVKGAYTGALSARRGLIGAADGGTLFLDEIGDMPLGLQAKLLRVLQERRYRPLGSDREEAVDLRLVTATHVDLPQRAENGSFRKDLFYRIAKMQIIAPPLRERGNDVLLLANAFLAELAQREPHLHKTLGKAAQDRLLTHDFPGNVRELQAIIERACALSGERLEIDDSDLGLEGQLIALEHDSAPLTLPEACERFQMVVIEKSLERHGGSRQSAAQELGIPLRTLSDKIKKYRLDERA